MSRFRNRIIPVSFLHKIMNLTYRNVQVAVVDLEAANVIGSAHTVEQGVRSLLGSSSSPGPFKAASVDLSKVIGEVPGEQMQQRGINGVYWRRPGKYHGKRKTFFDGVSEKGIKKYTLPHPKM